MIQGNYKISLNWATGRGKKKKLATGFPFFPMRKLLLAHELSIFVLLCQDYISYCTGHKARNGARKREEESQER